MSHPLAAPIPAAPADPPDAEAPMQPILMADRSTPGWARALGAVFALAALGAALAVAVATIYLVQSANRGADLFGAGLITAVAAVPALGLLVLEIAHARALAGYRHARRRLWASAQGIGGAALVLLLALVHPYLAAPPLVAILLAGGGLLLLRRMSRSEPAWDFRPEEAAAFLTGRDEAGLDLARRPVGEHPVSPGVQSAGLWLSLLGTTALASVLVAREVLAPEALVAVVLLAGLATDRVLRALRGLRLASPFAASGKTVVEAPVLTPQIGAGPSFGLHVRALTVTPPGGRPPLSEVSFEAQPGTLTALIGESGAGKTVLMRAMTDPFSLGGCRVTGRVTINGADLWRRRAEDRGPLAVRTGPDPVLLPVTGAENLTCFQTGAALDRGKAVLHQLVFRSDLVEEICAAPDATRLPGLQQRALCLARAFLAAPQVYLFDQPDAGLPDKQVGAFLGRLKQEARLGRTVLIATENRQILDACDRVVVLQGGRVVDFGDAAETRARLGTGWRRFVGQRQLEIEDSLHSWVRSHFRRDGDEGNRRAVATISSEMLAFSCIGAGPSQSGRITFEFKHHEGYCLLRMMDEADPVTSATLQMARDLARTTDPAKRLPPLAALLRDTLALDVAQDGAIRTMTAQIATYDPREATPPKQARDARSDA